MAYFFTFVQPSVDDGVGLVLGVFANSVACKSTDSMLVNWVSCLDGIDVCGIIIIVIIMDGGQEGLELTHQVKWEAKMSGFVGKLCNAFFGILGVGLLDVVWRMSLAVGYMTLEGVLLAEWM